MADSHAPWQEACAEQKQQGGAADREAGTTQSQRARQSGAPIQGCEAAVWLRQSALPRAEKERLASDDALYVCQPVESEKATGADGITAPEMRPKAPDCSKKWQFGAKKRTFLDKKLCSRHQRLPARVWGRVVQTFVIFLLPLRSIDS